VLRAVRGDNDGARMAMNEKDRTRLEKRLLEERERRVKALDRVDEAARISTEDDGDLTQYTQHPADEGTDTMEQEKALMLLARDTEALAYIDEALRRLYKEPELYGRCDGCGRDIELERLDVVPWALLCVSCQREAESAG
jgi:DnaK suppressor protein